MLRSFEERLARGSNWEKTWCSVAQQGFYEVQLINIVVLS